MKCEAGRDRAGRLARRERSLALHQLALRRVVLLDGVAAGRTAIWTKVLIFVALGQDQQQALAHLHRPIAFGTGEQTRLEAFERRPSILRHSVMLSR